MIKVTEGRHEHEITEFIRFPFKIYKNDPLYSPELIRDQREHFSPKNPFFDHSEVKFFIARRGEEVLGRITSIINHLHLDYQKEKAGFFGFFESVDDEDIAHALLERSERELRNAGMEVMRGPMSFSTNEQCGFLIEGYNETPMLMTPYNPNYYLSLVESYGMTKAKDLLAFVKVIPEELPEKVLRVAALSERRGISVKHVQKKRFTEALKAFKEIYNEAWGENWGFVPLTDDEVGYLGRRLKPIMVPEMTLIAVKDGEPVGFLGILPDYNYVLRQMGGRLTPFSLLKALFSFRKIRELRLLLLGVKPSYRHRGVDALMIKEAFRYVKGRYERIEFSWILEDNDSIIRLVDMIGGTAYKRYRIYEKRI
jgi:GNAT superfamily N-acetyltransferase